MADRVAEISEQETRVVPDPWLSELPLDTMLKNRGIRPISAEIGTSMVGGAPLVEHPNKQMLRNGVRFSSNGLFVSGGDGEQFSIDFMPYGETSQVDQELRTLVLFKCYLGTRDFIAYADEDGLEDNIELKGTTNKAMANMAEKFGFSKRETGFQSFEVSGTVGGLRKVVKEYNEDERYKKIIQVIEQRAKDAYSRIKNSITPVNIEYQKIAIDLSRFVLEHGDYAKRCAVAGSVSKGKEIPGDLDMVIVVPKEIYQKYAREVIDRLSGASKSDMSAISFVGSRLDSDDLSERLGDKLEDLYPNDLTVRKHKAKVDLILVPDEIDEETAELAAKANIDPFFVFKILSTSKEIRGNTVWSKPGLEYKPYEMYKLLVAAVLVKKERAKSKDYKIKFEEFKNKKELFSGDSESDKDPVHDFENDNDPYRDDEEDDWDFSAY